mmetsp:Transcript_13835/g.36284  ORF Transcript_13835/g.36284 Transcript_13835/m.36284 type:complete len:233 (+) Transcript_13835:609-1307(+)
MSLWWALRSPHLWCSTGPKPHREHISAAYEPSALAKRARSNRAASSLCRARSSCDDSSACFWRSCVSRSRASQPVASSIVGAQKRCAVPSAVTTSKLGGQAALGTTTVASIRSIALRPPAALRPLYSSVGRSSGPSQMNLQRRGVIERALRVPLLRRTPSSGENSARARSARSSSAFLASSISERRPLALTSALTASGRPEPPGADSMAARMLSKAKADDAQPCWWSGQRTW